MYVVCMLHPHSCRRWADQQGTLLLPKVRFLSGEERVIQPWAYTQTVLKDGVEALCVRVQVRRWNARAGAGLALADRHRGHPRTGEES
jgi:hypothetical protein